MRPLLALGEFSADRRVALAVAASEAAFEAHFVDSTRAAAEWLESRDPHAIVVDEASSQAERLCLEARAQARHAHIPILALAADLDDLSFAEVFNWGGDDAVESQSLRSLIARLRTIPTTDVRPPTTERGAALIVDSDHKRRIVLGRVLRNAGYSISFGVSEQDALERCRSMDLVVASHDVTEAPARLLDDARSDGCQALWIVTTPPKQLAMHRNVVEAFERATVTDGFAPPENIVFVANELSRGGAPDNRASRRLLYGTKVAFRGAGRERDDYGYSYNISLGGLYVRTLAPPADDRAWLELRPPRVDCLVRVEGRVVWRRPFGPAGHATVPPGFGVEIVDGTRANLENWATGYRAFNSVLGFADTV